MRSKILASSKLLADGWVGNAFGAEGIIGIGAGASEDEFVASLRVTVNDYLVTNGQQWLKKMAQMGAPEVLICPEGAIKLPSDLWMCKVVRETCPIQAQVFLDEPEKFFAGCLVDEDRKRAIFKAVNEGKYGGFHHVSGRYLCVRCADENGSTTPFSYHYPWELSALEDFAPFDYRRDFPDVLRKLLKASVARSAVQNALCARHSVEIAKLLYPEVAANLRILEFEIARPGNFA